MIVGSIIDNYELKGRIVELQERAHAVDDALLLVVGWNNQRNGRCEWRGLQSLQPEPGETVLVPVIAKDRRDQQDQIDEVGTQVVNEERVIRELQQSSHQRPPAAAAESSTRSEERRVGKECRYWWAPEL